MPPVNDHDDCESDSDNDESSSGDSNSDSGSSGGTESSDSHGTFTTISTSTWVSRFSQHPEEGDTADFPIDMTQCDEEDGYDE